MLRRTWFAVWSIVGVCLATSLTLGADKPAYWAYQPVQPQQPPTVKNSSWGRSPLDAFVLAKLEAKGLTPNRPADKVALLRRTYYDLVGLPPTPTEVESFVNDTSPTAFAKVVDKLLDSPHYGEKWGRHWLDLVRYAESHGYERDSAKPFAWRFRDYVIDSFNQDKPYHQFLREQLAGDELDQVTPESLIATGYYRLGIWDDEPADRLLAKYDVLDGVVSTTGSVMLGMSLGCARCHDHKKDPLLAKDYYQLLAYFRDVTDMNRTNTKKLVSPELKQQQEQALRAKEAAEGLLYQQIYGLEQEFVLGLAQKKLGNIPGVRSSDLTDLHYRFYRDTFEKLPDFEALKHETSGPIAKGLISLEPASRKEAIGLVFEGKLKVPNTGEYTFALQSSEGVKLVVAGQTVFDKPTKGQHQAERTVTLAAGLLPMRLEYFNTTTTPVLKLTWAGPGVEQRALTADRSAEQRHVLIADSRKAGQNWLYTTTAPGPGWMRADFPVAEWKKGLAGFGTKGTPGGVIRTEWNTPKIWLRTEFNVEKVPSQLLLDLHHDEDVEVFLNGKKVYEAVGFLKEYTRVTLGDNAVQALKPGKNLLAVLCKQTGGGQYIDVGLSSADQPDLSVKELLAKHGEEVLGKEKSTRYTELTAKLEQSRKQPVPEIGMEVMCVEERGSAPTHVLVRGLPTNLGEQVQPGVPSVLRALPPPNPMATPAGTSGKRRAFAAWLTDDKNPLTARVFVNRVWQYHFGRGIVPTTNDFGKLGEAPTHPELLDWLAADFMAGGWKLKRLHKLILLSNTYQMSSTGSEQGLKQDPANVLYWRFPMRRLIAEEVRDTLLVVSGKLELKRGGPSIYPPIPREVLQGQSRPGEGWHTSPPAEASRRSVYVHVKRSLQLPILALHDQADTDSSCPQRYTTTVPTQALSMINSDFMHEQAKYFADRLARESPNDLPGQIKRAYQLSVARTPSEDEVKRDAEFVDKLKTQYQLSPEQALQRYCLLALNANEMLYLD